MCEDVHEALVMAVLLYGSETLILREKERYRTWAVQMENLRGVLGIRRIDRVLNEQIRVLYRMMKGVDEGTNKMFLQWFDHIE